MPIGNATRPVGANRQSAIGNDLAVAEGFEPSIAGLTIRCLTNLATPQENWLRRREVELAHPRLQDECSVIQLSYAAIWWTGRDSNPHKKFARLRCCRYITSPKLWWLWVESNHQPRAYETLALIPHELHSRFRILEARGGVEPRAFPPSSCRFGLEDRRRERGP